MSLLYSQPNYYKTIEAMKTILTLFLWIGLLIGVFTSCSEGIRNDLILEMEELTLTDVKGVNRLIGIKSGNGNYSIWSDNEKVVKALYRKEYGEYISVSPESAGKSTITIRDNDTGQFRKIAIHVVPHPQAPNL